MFSAAVKSVDGNVKVSSVEAVSGCVNKRSTVCDADATGRVNPNCRR